MSEKEIESLISKNFDFRPKGLINYFNLKNLFIKIQLLMDILEEIF